MRVVRRDPNITDEERARRRACMADRAAMRSRNAHDDDAQWLAVKLATILKHAGPPMTVAEFEAEWDRRDALAAAGRVLKTD